MDACKVLVHMRVLSRVQALHGEANVIYWKRFERQNSTHLTLLKHQNTKTAQYKLPKNHWVISLFEISGPVRNKLLVTVSLDHPVLASTSNSVHKTITCLNHYYWCQYNYITYHEHYHWFPLNDNPPQHYHRSHNQIRMSF